MHLALRRIGIGFTVKRRRLYAVKALRFKRKAEAVSVLLILWLKKLEAKQVGFELCISPIESFRRLWLNFYVKWRKSKCHSSSFCSAS